MTPDLIHDTALIAVSQWQRETTQQWADRILPIWQARKHLPAEQRFNDNHQDSYSATLEAVRGEMGHG